MRGFKANRGKLEIDGARGFRQRSKQPPPRGFLIDEWRRPWGHPLTDQKNSALTFVSAEVF